MSVTFAIVSALIITLLVFAAVSALMLPSEKTHRVWAARVAQIRAARAARISTRSQARANRAQVRAARARARAQVRASRARAAWREVNKG